MSEQSTGGYDAEGVIWHQHSNRLLIKIMELFPKNVPIIDIGCGHNFYISALIYCGWTDKCFGIDMVDLYNKHACILDVTKPIPNTGVIHNILSLEVGEHIPAELSDGYLDNLTRFGGDVIMSWAVEGQAGVGHINCRNNDWVEQQMNERGYALIRAKTSELRAAVEECHCSWFRNTLMYFKPAK